LPYYLPQTSYTTKTLCAIKSEFIENGIKISLELISVFYEYIHIELCYQSKEEKTMVNKKIWLGILVLVLVFGMAAIGCKEPEPRGPLEGLVFGRIVQSTGFMSNTLYHFTSDKAGEYQYVGSSTGFNTWDDKYDFTYVYDESVGGVIYGSWLPAYGAIFSVSADKKTLTVGGVEYERKN
jgi:hypothetical protein